MSRSPVNGGLSKEFILEIAPLLAFYDVDSKHVQILGTEKFNVKGVTAHLGRGVSFISSISSFNQQLEDQAKSDAGSGAGAG